MDTPERYDGPPPSWPPAQPKPQPLQAAWDDPLETSDAPARAGVSPKIVWRALRRHWWLALLVWVVGSAGLVVLAHKYIKPTFESTAWLKVDTSAQPLIPGVRAETNDQTTLLETQVQLITSPDVLGTAVLDPKVAALPRIRQSLDPEVELRSVVRVGIQPRTQLILVSMASESPYEAAAIVGAVVEAYLKTSERWTDTEAREQITRLKEMKKKVENDRNRLRETLERLSQKSVESQINPTRSDLISIERYRQYKDEQGRIELDLNMAESTLDTLQKFDNERAERGLPRHEPLRGDGLEAEVRRAFLADPEVVDLRRSRKAFRERFDGASRIAVDPADPAVRKWRGELDKVDRQYQELWSQKAPLLRRQLAVAIPQEEMRDEGTAQLRQAKIDVQRLKAAEARIRKQLETIEIDTKNEGSEALAAQFARVDLSNSDTILTAIEQNLTQLEYTRGGRIGLISPARPSLKPMGKKRLMAMAGGPVFMLGLVLGVVVLFELKSGRVADPDDQPARVRVGVLGVVPPLPTGPPSRGPKALRDEKRRVEGFIQSLDHLRVALCAGQTGAAGRRCLLITSACGGEGKTTLAAQLAGRCANAGLLTLLIDADLRRPSLGELLEVPEGPGLADILLDEVEPEIAMVVIGSAGGFHLLPAGTPGHDPARLLQGERLGQLVAQFRATFDVVIIDAPPVLAVPDALLLGRWTDGAVLAVRHDTSRYPLVERANRRLASIGIPVLGAVVNGVRTVETSYGSYHYAATGRYDEPQDA
jgi:capsular exopolysaccharide synthesis family protein